MDSASKADVYLGQPLSTANVCVPDYALSACSQAKQLIHFLMLPQYSGPALDLPIAAVPQPTAAQLTDIALASAETWRAITGRTARGDAVVSSNGSARHPCVATSAGDEIVRERAPAGCRWRLQFDAAFVRKWRRKRPASPLQAKPIVMVSIAGSRKY